jgi:hypothetical protein
VTRYEALLIGVTTVAVIAGFVGLVAVLGCR